MADCPNGEMDICFRTKGLHPGSPLVNLPQPLGAAQLDPRRHHRTYLLAGLAVLFVLAAFNGGIAWSALLAGVVLGFAAHRSRAAVRAGDTRAERARKQYTDHTKYCGGCDQILLRGRAKDGSFSFSGIPRQDFRAEFLRRGARFPGAEEAARKGSGGSGDAT
ncbi:hypothetical protein AB0J57_07735 [Streptomyces sp. NPDC049837]|uniref:hypothetical protein n=1 Tax=Streptomyces sp. NPDC049837 TaxID=3155277 RepID=UPI003425B422